MISPRFSFLAAALCAGTIVLGPRLGASEVPSRAFDSADQAPDSGSGVAKLVQRVREATEAFRHTIPAEYQQFLGCVSGPDKGAMGVHFVNFNLVDGQLDVTRPEALIYELRDGRARLLGVEFIVPAELWDAAHDIAPLVPPELEGQVFHFTESPNRFRLPAFYELHVWAWRDNPSGTFADWNPQVSCDRQ